jgi:DNA topoisomerase-1
MVSAAEQNPLAKAARRVGLRYVTDEAPGFTRQKSGRGFRFVDARGKSVAERDAERAKGLAIPPAWTDVWVCRLASGHLQATGRDDRNRKQYRYHDKWQKVESGEKYRHVAEFAKKLPAIRQQIDRDLRQRTFTLQRVCALALAIIDLTGARVGGQEYSRDNDTRGLATLSKKNAKVSGDVVSFDYIGKSHQKRHLEVHSRRLARQIAKLKEAPRGELFQFEVEGEWRDLTSQHLNDYLKAIAGDGCSTKQFRTWRGTLVAYQERLKRPQDEEFTKKARNEVVAAVAETLGNTKAVATRHYIHPAVLEADAKDLAALKVAKLTGGKWLSKNERRLLTLID